MRTTVLAALAASLLFFLSGASADVAVPAPQLRVDDEGVGIAAYWCPVLVTSGPPRPCGDGEWIARAELSGVVLEPLCVDRIADDARCEVVTPSVAASPEGAQIDHPLLP